MPAGLSGGTTLQELNEAQEPLGWWKPKQVPFLNAQGMTGWMMPKKMRSGGSIPNKIAMTSAC